MPKWIDLKDKTTGGKLKVARIEGGTYLFVVGLSSNSPRWRAAIERLNFVPGGNGRFLIRKVLPGERPGAGDFRGVWPNAVIEDMPTADFQLELGRGKSAPVNEEDREISEETANARRLGRNADGLEVYESDLGRFIWKDGVGSTYESPTMRPAMVLRAPDAASLDLCADGFVQGMVRGEVQHSEDFDVFVHAVTAGAPPLPAVRTRLHSAIDAAAVRHLVREFDTAQDAYGESVRLYEMLPPYSGERRGEAAMPSPLTVIAQRLLGDTAGKQVAIPNAFDGASFSFLPKGTRVRAYRGQKDLSEHAGALTELAKERAEVEWREEFVPARETGAGALFFNADPVRGRDGQRSDYRDALMASRALAEGGRAVLVLAGDDPLHPGVFSDESQRFMHALASRYQVEEAFEVGAQLAQRVGTGASLRLISLRNLVPDQDNAWLDAKGMRVAHSWDEVKTLVDEALARAKVREAESEAINVDRATDVGRLQSPYLAFSKVGEARTMVPKNLQAPLQAALSEIEAHEGPVDDFVTRELGFGENTLGERFGPEQIDAIALMISRLKKSRAPILADETGVGKGRSLAALCTWAAKQARPVVFITDRANLFSDMARDMRDIGEWGRFRPLITNADGHIVETVKPIGQEGAAAADDAASGTMTVLARATPSGVMHSYLEDNVSLEEAGANIVFTTYSQIAGEDNPKAQWIKNQLEDALLVVDESHIAAGSDSSIARQLSEMTNIAWNVVYSSATWAKSSKNLHIYARALPETVNIASLTETMARGGEGFSEVFSSMLARDGALIRREHDLSRLEFVLEIDHVNLERNRQVADLVSTVMGQISLVSGSLDKMMVRLSRASLDALRAARDTLRVVGMAARQRHQANADGERTSIFRSAFGAGSMLYQVQRRMNAALNIDNVERLAKRAIEEGRKPVIVFDDTSESFVKRAMERAVDEPGEPAEWIRTPSLHDLLRRVVEDLSTVKVSEVTYDEVMAARDAGRDLVAEAAEEDDLEEIAQAQAEATGREVPVPPVAPVEAPQTAPAVGTPVDAEGIDVERAAQLTDDDETADASSKRVKRAPARRVRFDELPNLSEQQRRTFAEGIRQIEACIEAIPQLPLSVADALHQRLRAAGLKTGEISGRAFTLEEAGAGRSFVRNRAKSKSIVNKTVDAFNSFDLDAILINRSAATGLSLHASPRFRDRRRRELVECQAPENPTDRVQLYGRVNRYDQVSYPRITIAATGIPGETRHLMMQNKKLSAMSANVRSSRESHAIIGSVTDLLNPIGRETCRQFLLDNPLYATRMAQDLKRIEDKTVDAASAFTRYISLLPVEQQDSLYEQVNQLFEEAVLKAEMSGDNPLKPKEFDWKAVTVAQDVVFGIDHGGLGSAFDGPVYARAVRYVETLKPMNWATVCLAIAGARARMIERGHAVQVGTMLDDLRTPLVSMEGLSRKTVESVGLLARVALAATDFATVEEALHASGDNPVKRGMGRKHWLEKSLHMLVPGARLSLPHPNKIFADNGGTVPHIVVDVTPPKEGRESMLGQWKVALLKPGQEKPVAHSLSSLMTSVRFLGMDDQGEASGYSNIVVGSDVVLHQDARANETLIESFNRSPSGQRTRTAAILAGNMYLASEFATQAKIGHGMIYSDDRGLRQRAILMDSHFGAESLRSMPVRVWVPRAVERLMLEISGLSEERVVRGAGGVETAGEGACEANSAQGYLMHTSFSGAWQYTKGNFTGLDAINLVPGGGIVLTVGKEQATRVYTGLGAAQRAVREEEAKAASEARRARGDPDDEESTTPALAGRRRRRKAAEDPNHVVLSRTKGVRGGQGAAIVFKADSPAKMRRAIKVLTKGVGLQLYVSPHSALGKLAREVVREDLLRRLRSEIGDNPERLAQLQVQIERMDSENAVSRQGFGRIRTAQRRDEWQLELIERDGEFLSAAQIDAIAHAGEANANADDAGAPDTQDGALGDEAVESELALQAERPRNAA